MDFKNCPECGKLFLYSGRSIVCDECTKKDSQDFEKVRSYLRENPKQKLADVSEATGVSVKKINKYIQDGRLVASEGLSGAYKCSSCGVGIQRGRFCDSCAKKLSTRASNVLSEGLKKSSTVRMHTKKD